MTVKAKRFRIGVEGATTDGREIQREWLEQMAASYNPAVYTALINLEHIKSYLPDSTFNRYGKVTALFAEEITEGPLAGKMALYADVEPTESLVELVKKGQKLFTSMEVSPKFADTGKAYLVGLAATDDPASLGTEMLTFSASAAHNPLANRKQNPANLFTAAEETVIELEEIQDDKPSLFARVTALFTKKEQSDDARFSDVHKAVELVATEQQNLSARTEKSLSEQEERLSELETALQEQQTAFNELVNKLSHEDSRQDYGSSNSNQQRVVLAGWRTTGTAATRACFIGQRRRFTYCAVVVFAPHGITDGKCPENCSRCAGCTFAVWIIRFTCCCCDVYESSGGTARWTGRRRHGAASTGIWSTGDAARCPVCHIWSVRCSAQSDRSCGYCTGGRGAGCLEKLATHHRISRWRGGRIQSGGRSHQCSVRTA